MNEFNVVIIGGSFIGMSCAIYLQHLDPTIKIAILEKSDLIKHNKDPDGRNYTISAKSLALFDKIGITHQILQKSGIISNVSISDGGSSAILNFLESSNKDAGNLGAVIESHHLHKLLKDTLLANQNIKIFSETSYQNIEFGESECDAAITLSNGKIIKAEIILACDGRFSALRSLYQIPTREKKYQEIALVFDIEHQKPHKNIAYEKFFATGPIALLPKKNENHSSVVWIASDDLASELLKIDQDNFTHQLQKRIEQETGEIKLTSEKFSYPLIAIKSQKFYHKNLIFVGDAACGVHPIAGQGLNLGLTGVDILCKMIDERRNCGLSLNSNSLFETYQKVFDLEAEKMLIATDLLNSVFKNRSRLISLGRKAGLELVKHSKILKKFFVSSAGGSN